MAERQSPECWAGMASWPWMTSQHHVIPFHLERLSSCLASLELGTVPGLPVPSRTQTPGRWPRLQRQHLGGVHPPAGHSGLLCGVERGVQGTVHPWLTPKPRVQDMQPRVTPQQGEGLAGRCFPRDSQHSSWVSSGWRTPPEPWQPLPSA